ncbi:hypothetical protein NDU88_002052 [Pleurodeles waltl]|uniref:Uncharacterized protein n=1 Tax=Pleurodeles waltl TaxID=8319 RepID=A0AAV7UWG2_PLEWA|nr:hypothetical protein NDU88_002052 [Pleurodeles waltl]
MTGRGGPSGAGAKFRYSASQVSRSLPAANAWTRRCNRASIAAVTNGCPGLTESYPGGTYKRTADPEELSDPEIRDAAAAIRGKEKPERVCLDTSGEDPWRKTETERRPAPGAEERTESKEEDAGKNANNRRSDPRP